MPLGRVNICSTDCSLPPPPILRSSSVRLELLHFWKGYRVLSLSLSSLGFRHLAAFVPPVSQKCLVLASVFLSLLLSVPLSSLFKLLVCSLLTQPFGQYPCKSSPGQYSLQSCALMVSSFPRPELLPFCPFSLEFWVLSFFLTFVWQLLLYKELPRRPTNMSSFLCYLFSCSKYSWLSRILTCLSVLFHQLWTEC